MASELRGAGANAAAHAETTGDAAVAASSADGDAGASGEADTGADTDAGADTSTGANAGTGTGADTSTGANADTGTGADTSTGANADTDAGADTSTGANAGTGTGANARIVEDAGEDSAEVDRRYFRDTTSREAFRQKKLDELPSWYSPWLHFTGTAGIGVVMLALAIWQLEALAPLELLVVPIVFVLSNLGEWHAHKNLLHRRWKPIAVLYDQHTPMHHRIYRYHSMQIREVRELKLILIPAAGVLTIIAVSAPAAALAGWLFTANVGWLFLLTTSSYVVGYELSHLAYHLPESSLVYKLPFMHVLREHHARHHDPRLMQKYNFNVTIPLADWVFGTSAPKELIAKLDREHAARSAA